MMTLLLRSHVAGIEPGRSDLIEQGLEGVMIPLVDERDLHGLFAARQVSRGCEPAETSSNNDDVMSAHADPNCL